MGVLKDAAEKLLELATKMRDPAKSEPPAIGALAARLLACELECEVRTLTPEVWDEYVLLRDQFVKLGDQATSRIVRRRQQ
jgi:hypothetical protein